MWKLFITKLDIKFLKKEEYMRYISNDAELFKKLRVKPAENKFRTVFQE